MESSGYSLNHSKKQCKLVIDEVARGGFYDSQIKIRCTEDSLYVANDYYTLSKSKDALVKKASELKVLWIKEARDRLSNIKSIVIN